MSRRRQSNFLAAFLIVSLAVILQLKIGLIANLYPNFTLAALIALAFFLDFSELGFLVILSALVLNWRPGLSPEILTLISLPIAVFIFRRLLPAHAWLSFALVFIIGLSMIYSAAGFSLMVNNFSLFFVDLAISIVFAVPTFFILKSFHAQ